MGSQLLPTLSAQELTALASMAPRYTSYPTVPHWMKAGDTPIWKAAVASVNGPAAVYVHVPFCWKHCWYCGCNMVVSGNQVAGDRYLDAIEKQIGALELRDEPTVVRRIHLGGGTPTWLSPDQLRRLMSTLLRRFKPEPGAELSAEVHPNITTQAHLDALAECGFTRLSIGVQSTNADVLAAIGREQTFEEVTQAAEGARKAGITKLNLDLVYGLPCQTPATWARTLAEIESLAPDRLAIYAYAHVPWLREKQNKVDESALPNAVQRSELALQAWGSLIQAGYSAIGMDHFAKPHDSLAIAAANGTMSRDFMGYTDRSAPLIGLGPSAISELGKVYVQHQSHLGAWYRAIEKSEPLVQRHFELNHEDDMRRALIRGLMCDLEIDLDRFGREWSIDAKQHFADELVGMEPWRVAGAIVDTPNGIKITNNGRLLLRNVAAVFDTYMTGQAKWRVAPSDRD